MKLYEVTYLTDIGTFSIYMRGYSPAIAQCKVRGLLTRKGAKCLSCLSVIEIEEGEII